MMNILEINNKRVISIFLLLGLLGLVPSVMAECLQSYSFSQEPELQDANIADVDANLTCDGVVGQFGCTIKQVSVGQSCDYSDTQGNQFTATIKAIDSFGVRWEITNNNIEIDTVSYGGGSGGKNNCVAFHTYDVTSGSGGDCKSFDTNGTCVGFSNFTALSLCSDFVQEDAPPPPPVARDLPNCNDINNKLDNTGVICPTDEMGMTTNEPVVVCNLQKDKPDWGTSDGSDVCCQCNIPDEKDVCIVSPDNPDCARTMTVDPTQTVELMFFRADNDPCFWSRTSSGWEQICWPAR